MIKKIFFGIVALFGLFLSFGSKGAYDSPLLNNSTGGGGDIVISHTAWEDALVTSHIVEELLTEAGYSVELVQLDPAILFSSLASGQSDFSVSPWLPLSHGPYYEQFEDQLEYLGYHATGAQNALVVPAYMEVDSIPELTDEAGQVITGMEPGAAMTVLTNEALEVYPNLSGWEHHESSTGAMLTEVDQAIRQEEEIVFPGWTPHWMFIEYDLKMLEDPENVYGGGEDLSIVSRLGFSEEHPEIASFLDGFEWSVDDVSQAMLYVSEGLSADQAADRWMSENPDKVEEWRGLLQ
jgi:glycine betaine/proline transport system substrate-binding protein